MTSLLTLPKTPRNKQTDKQSGYRPGHNSQLQLAYLTDKMYKSLGLSEDFAIIFLAISRYFKKIWHSALLAEWKLEFGIKGPLLCWLSSCLAGKSQVVEVEINGLYPLAWVERTTPTSLLPHQHFTLLPLLATPKAHQIYTFNVFGHTIFENESPPMPISVADRCYTGLSIGPSASHYVLKRTQRYHIESHAITCFTLSITFHFISFHFMYFESSHKGGFMFDSCQIIQKHRHVH